MMMLSRTRGACIQAPRRTLNPSCSRVVVVVRSEAGGGPPASDAEKASSTISSLDALLGTKDVVKVENFNWSASSPAPAAPVRAAVPIPARKEVAPPAETWESVMGFGGLAPEVINGRVAMIAFMLAISSELSDGQSVYVQALSGGAGRAAILIMLISLASFAPGVNRANLWSTTFGKGKTPTELGPFNANAEIINGRAAMIGLFGMVFLEGISSYAFFS